jgi:chromosome segregation ATPase
MDEITRDRASNDTGDITWMTYADLGRARGISTASAKRLAIRRRWRRHQGNDGTARVAVPVTEANQREARPDTVTSDITGGDVSSEAVASDPGDIARVITALEGAIALLREQLAQAQQQVTAERNRADLAEACRDGERVRADALRDQITELQAKIEDTERRLVTVGAEAKAAHDRAWTSGEQQAAAERRAEAERARADRLEAQAAREREDFLDAEARTRRELETVVERVAQAEAHQDRLRAEVDSARSELAEARRSEDEWKGRGRWARLRAAWRGE